MFINLHSEKRHLVKQRIKCAQRTQPLAERAVEKHTQQDYRDQNAELPRKERTERGAYAGIDGGERYRTLKYPLRTKVLAEERISHTDIVCDKHWQQNYHKKQNRVFYVGQRLQLFGGDLFGRNLVQQLLKPSERTQKPADEAAEQHAEQNEKSCDVVGKAEFRRPHHCLKRADRTGTRCRRAGIAIESRNANGFSFSLIDAPLQKVRQMKVGQQCRSRLEQSAKA